MKRRRHLLRLIRRSVLSLAVCPLVLANAHGQEWTRFRGPNGSGVSDAVFPTTWTEQDYLWSVSIPGAGHSSPVLWGQKIFITTGIEATGGRTIVCLDAGNGPIVWSRELDVATHRKHRFNSFATSTPAVDADRVYVCWTTSQDLMMAALTHDGAEVWRTALGPFKGNHGFGVSPVVYGGLVVLPNDQDGDSSLIAVDCASGQVRWQIPRKSQRTTYATPCIFSRPGQTDLMIFTNWQHGITAVEPKTGSIAWEASVFPTDSKERAIGSPIVAGDLVVGSCGFVTAAKHLVALRPARDGASGLPREIYRIEQAVPHVPTPVANGDLLFLWSDQGIVTCIDLATGDVHWRKRVGGNFFGSPVCAGGRLYCIDKLGKVVVLAASIDFAVLGRIDLGDPSHSTPAVANNRLYLRTTSRLFCLPAAN